ncbi:MAG: YdcF family protein [Thermoplasmata archaeon]|jgi:uncharacterized SAM-binding protein YcdF (DUF218 family)|nr:YdcF family protein [Candidatus Sysuiplasma jiujiangense]MBX8639210.1 YdcF family protein [Candidatus Sysuiplasma jiujiangense]
MLTVVVVLGCRPDGNRPTPELTRRVKHGVETAMRASKRGESMLLFSGGKTSGTESEASIMHRDYELNYRDIAIPSILENRSLDTIGNAYFSARILKRLEYGRIVVVTSPFHVPRSKYLFSFILGRRVGSSTFGAVPGTVPKEEKAPLEMAKHLFAGVKSGDLDAVWGRMRRMHPYYMPGSLKARA